MVLAVFLITTIALFAVTGASLYSVLGSRLKTFVLLFGLYISYVSICSILLDTISIRIDGLSVSIINILTTITLYILFIKRKSINIIYMVKERTFSRVNIIDGYVVIGSLLISVIAFNYLYTSELNISFITTDPSVHYIFASNFSDTGRLLLSLNDLSPYAHMSSYPFLSYANTGLLMSFFSSEETKLGIYLVSNFFFYFFIILSAYLVYKSIVKKPDFIQATFLLVATAVGYNLNSIIFGFTSQMAGIFLVMVLLIVQDNFQKGWMRTLALSMIFVGLFYSYYYFIPAAFAAYIITEFFTSKQPRSSIKGAFRVLITKESIIVALATLVFGSLYLFILNNASDDVSSVANEGYIYRDLYSVFKPFLLFAIISYAFVKEETRKYSLFVTSIVFTVFAAVIFVFGMMGKASSYYFYKNHYLIENLLIILCCVGLYYAKSKFKPLYYSYIAILIFLGVQTFVLDGKIQERNNLFNVELERNITNVQKFNLVTMKHMDVIFTKSQRELLSHIEANKDKYLANHDHIPVIGDLLQQLWFYSYTEIWPKYNAYTLSALYEKPILDYQLWKNDNSKNPYLVIMDKAGEEWIREQGVDMGLFKVIYETNGAKLLEYQGF